MSLGIPIVCCPSRDFNSCVAYRAQLGRLGGSRWGWVHPNTLLDCTLCRIPLKNKMREKTLELYMDPNAPRACCLLFDCFLCGGGLPGVLWRAKRLGVHSVFNQ